MGIHIMIKVYTDQRLLTPENRPYVFPLLFDLWYNEEPDPQVAHHYQLTDKIEAASLLIYPIAVNQAIKQLGSAVLDQQLADWEKQQLPIWTYTSGDYGISLQQPFITQFRFGGKASGLPANTQIMPAFIPDPYQTQQKQFFTLEKKALPAIGFVGFSSKKPSVWCKALAATTYGNLRRVLQKDPTDRQPFFPAAYKRKQLLDRLAQSPKMTTAFIHRDQYRAGALAPGPQRRRAP